MQERSHYLKIRGNCGNFSTMKVALAQISPHLGSLKKNLDIQNQKKEK